MDIYASDEEKAEEIKRWWWENARTVVLAVIIGFATIFAVRAWLNYQKNQTVQASLVHQQVMASLIDGDTEQAVTATDGLMQMYPGSVYAVMSVLQLASEIDDVKQAKQYLHWAMHNAQLDLYKELARLRLARIEAGQGETERAMELISQASSQSYQSLFAELEGDIYKAKGDRIAASVAYRKALQVMQKGDVRRRLLQMKLEDAVVADES